MAFVYETDMRVDNLVMTERKGGFAQDWKTSIFVAWKKMISNGELKILSLQSSALHKILTKLPKIE